MLQSDISAQHLSVFGPLSVKEGNYSKNSSSQAKTSDFFEFHKEILLDLLQVFFTFSVSEMVKLLLSVLAHKAKLLTGQEYKLELLPFHDTDAHRC